MTNTVDIVLNKMYAFDVLHVDMEHGKKDWLRIAAEALAKELLKNGCIVEHSTYNIERGAYHTSFTVLTGRQRMELP